MGRNLKYQFLNAINKNFKEGMDKHSLKASHKMNDTRIFSYADRKNLIDTASNFSNWMKDNHPEVKQVKDVSGNHIQNFLNEKKETCSTETLKQYASKFNKLENIVNNTYDTNAKYKGYEVPVGYNATKIRNSSMSKEDFKKLEESFENSKSAAKIAIELSAKAGLRVSECVNLQARDIDIDKGVINVIGGKGGRDREIKIREEDKQYFEELKDQYKETDRICSVKEDSVNKAIQRELEKLDIKDNYKDTSIHCIRKMYAQEQFDNYREEGMSVKEALGQTSIDLGHSANRLKLMSQYVLDIK